jgi:deazaflavin-dependent oxidoreductase (nitroreductase family)
MAYLRPPAFQRKVFNPLAMRFGIGGSQTLAIRGRRSGEERVVPVIPVERDGVPYVVSARGESYWVRNLREAGTAELRGKGGSREYLATEVPVEERAPIIEAYREKAGRTVAGYWKKLPDPADHPVFRLEPK